MENLTLAANDNGASVYRHEPRSLDISDGEVPATNGTSAAELLLILALWGLFKPRTGTQSQTAVRSKALLKDEESST